MKRIFILVLLITVSVGVTSAQNREISFEHGSFAEALNKARSAGKLLFLDAYTSWCGPCKTMAKDVFTRDQVADFFNSTFVNSKMDMEQGEGLELVQKYDILVYPTFLLIDGEGKEVFRMVGASKADAFIASMKEGMNPETSIQVFDKKFAAGERNTDFIAEYLKKLKKAYKQEQVKLIIDEYFKDKSVEDICDVKSGNWALVQSYLNNIEMPLMKRMVREAEQFKACQAKDIVEDKLYAVYHSGIFNFLLRTPEITDEQFKAYSSDVKQINLSRGRGEALDTYLQLAYRKAHKDYDGYLAICESQPACLTPDEKGALVVTLTFFGEAPLEQKKRAMALLYKQVEAARKSPEGLDPGMEQTYGYVFYKIKGENNMAPASDKK